MELITASQIIVPSSPTPIRLKHHKLSFLDQITPPLYIPLIFFYKYDKSKPHVKISQRLRQSLSEILTIFYPLAGTIKENSFVDCDDTGTKFLEARVHARLGPLVQNPNMEELKRLVPIDSLSHNDNNILLVKISYFDCGGISIGVCLSHKIGDMASFVMFMNAWAATCRGARSRIILPSFDLALHFRPLARVPLPSRLDVLVTKKKLLTKRLVFESQKIDKLRQEAASLVKNPTKVEVVTAFIWRNFIEANKAMPQARKTSSFVASHVVNMRSRTVPPVPDNTFGNCCTMASAVMSSEEDDGDKQYVSKLKATIRAVDDDYIKKVIIENVNDFQTLNEASGLHEAGCLCGFTSWWRFPLYDVDFGWGNPDWVCTAQIPYENAVILMSTPSGDGMEAWVNMNPKEEYFFQLLQTNYTNLLT